MGAGAGGAEEAAPEARLGEAPPVGVRAGVVGATTGAWRQGELTAGAPRRCTNSSPSARTTIRTANPARYRTKTIGAISRLPDRRAAPGASGSAACGRNPLPFYGAVAPWCPRRTAEALPYSLKFVQARRLAALAPQRLGGER